jgi:hypothetical protein
MNVDVEQQTPERVLSHNICTWMLRSNVPAQMIKDIVAMRVVQHMGGIVADLDVHWLGRPLPMMGECLLCLEPCRNPAGQPYGRGGAVHHAQHLWYSQRVGPGIGG